MVTAGTELRQVPLGEITVGPNYRRDVGDVGELVESIRTHGMLHPVIARPAAAGVELVVGQRRHAAAARLGLETIPVLVREISDAQVLDLQVAENLNREDPSPLDEADAFGALRDRGDTLEELGARFGRTAAFVAQRVQLRDLVPAARTLLTIGRLPIRHAAALAQLAPEDQQDAIADGGHGGSFGVGSLREWRRRLQHYQRRLVDAKFDREDLHLNEGAGPCSSCPHRTHAQPQLFEDAEDQEPDRCLRPSCWDEKLRQHVDRAVAAVAKKAGVETLPRLPHANIGASSSVNTWTGPTHVGLGNHVAVGHDWQPWSKVLRAKKRPPPDAVVVSDGKVVPAWKPTTLIAAAKAAGITVGGAAAVGQSAGENRQRQEARRWNEVADRLFADLPERLPARDRGAGFVIGTVALVARFLLRAALDRATNDSAKRAVRRLALERQKVKDVWGHAQWEGWRDVIDRRIPELGAAEAVALALELLAVGYGIQDSLPPRVQQLAELVDFDTSAAHRQVIEAERAVAKARAKKAMKKKPAKGAGPAAAAAAAPPAKKPRKKARKSPWAALTDEEKKDRVRKLVAGGPRARASGQEGGAA